MDKQIRDPVCGMAVDPMSPRKETADGREYYFCSDACQHKFQENPAAYGAKPT
jgi:Cu+-exporting ATPase